MSALPLLEPPPGCLLTPQQFAEQLDRIRTLRASVRVMAREVDTLSLVLGEVDGRVLDAFVETERRCCPLLEVEYDPAARVLRLSALAGGYEVLATFAEAFAS